jgi:hypothetical protein
LAAKRPRFEPRFGAIIPWILGFTHTRAMHVGVGFDAMVTFLSVLELWLITYEPRYGSHSRQS